MKRFIPTIYFLVCFVAGWTGREMGLKSAALTLAVFVAATVATLHLLHRRLPLQNIFALAVVITVFSGALLVAENFLHEPLSPPFFNRSFTHLTGWSFPLLWIIALINAREIARFILQRLRKNLCYGWWLILLGCLLAACLNLNLGFRAATFAKHFFLTAIAFIATTPWFIDKKKLETKPGFQPLLVVMLLMIW